MERKTSSINDLYTGAFQSIFIRRWMKTAVFFFFLAAVFGTSMRYFFVAEIPVLNYKNLLHAHSHVALLGWGYMLVSGSLIFLILSSSTKPRIYRHIFIINVISTLGMALFFTYQGYGAFSIFFSTIHVLSVYYYAYHFLRELKSTSENRNNLFIRWSIYWLLLSTAGLWAIAPISALLGKLHPLYYMSIQFFLHFQFNGWFTYAIIGLLLFHFAKKGYETKIPVTGFWLLQLSLLLTYALSVTWSTPLSFIFYLNSLGVALQAIAFILILTPILKTLRQESVQSDWTDWLLITGLACLIIKVIIQIAVAIPYVATISYTIRNYVIGFIHLIMLGSVTMTGVAILLKNNLLPSNHTAKTGWLLLAFAFIATELILFGQGTLLWMGQGFIPYYYEVILAVTILLPVSLIIILLSFRNISISNKYMYEYYSNNN